MFIKNLLIKSAQNIIREVNFHQGVNLITTPNDKNRESNVGKTTVIDLIDIMLGADSTKKIKAKFSDDLIGIIKDKEIVLELNLVSDFSDAPLNRHTLRFYFNRNRNKYSINNKEFTIPEYKATLKSILFPDSPNELHFRDLIKRFESFNLSESAVDVLKYLSPNPTNEYYELLYTYFLNSGSSAKSSDVFAFREQQKKIAKSKKDKQINLKDVPKIFEKSFEKIEGYNEKNLNLILYQKLIDEHQDLRLRLEVINNDFSTETDNIDEEVINILLEELGSIIEEPSQAFDMIIEFNKKREENRTNQLTRMQNEIMAKMSELELKIMQCEQALSGFVNLKSGEGKFSFDDYNNILKNKFVETSRKSLDFEIAKTPIESIDELISDGNLNKFNKNLNNFTQKICNIYTNWFKSLLLLAESEWKVEFAIKMSKEMLNHLMIIDINKQCKDFIKNLYIRLSRTNQSYINLFDTI